jgi:hypothetical protein
MSCDAGSAKSNDCPDIPTVRNAPRDEPGSQILGGKGAIEKIAILWRSNVTFLYLKIAALAVKNTEKI